MYDQYFPTLYIQRCKHVVINKLQVERSQVKKLCRSFLLIDVILSIKIFKSVTLI